MEVDIGSIEERIIKASFDILEQEGINGATTKKIAEKANVSEVTLFRKFKNKQKLIEIAKDYYFENLLRKLEIIFSHNNEEIKEYLKKCFYEVSNLTDQELNILKVGIEEVRNVPNEYKMFPKLTETVTRKLSEFFKLKMELKEIREVNPNVLALNIFSILIQSIVLWKIYDITPQYSIDKYIEDFLDITINGIDIK